MRRILLILVLALLAVAAPSALAQSQPAKVTLESLLREMADLERLATLPDPWYDCAQQSSYDRASVAPDRDGWFANGDAGNFIREEQRGTRTEYVIAEMDGPGAIVRLWSANPEAGGNLRIYVDDMNTPALEADFFALTSGQMADFPPPFTGRRALGANLYFPITYQHRCKVTVEKPELYYHVGYRTYAPGTIVEPFSMSALPALRETMHEVALALQPQHLRVLRAPNVLRSVSGSLRPGEDHLVLDLYGPSAITYLQLSLRASHDLLPSVLRECLLTIRFDDQPQPSVWAPVGDFFGSTPGINPYTTLPLGMERGGPCYSNWYMPFASRAEIRLHNESSVPVEFALIAWVKPIQWEAGKTLHFHAKWRKQWFPARPEFLDWPVLEASGPGRFVGTMLGVANSSSGWWGEGDEKIWVDDDVFPSFFGTGTEDYFGYAWGNTQLFSHPYHSQSLVTGPGHYGYTALARFHILDDIPFRSAIRFYLEKWGGADREYCATAYWYAAPGASDFFHPVPVGQRRLSPLPPLPQVPDAFEAETLAVNRCTGGYTDIQDLDDRFSGSRHLWWIDPEVGALLELKVPLRVAGRYRVSLGLTTSWDYGIHQPLLNGIPAGEPLDLFSPSVAPLRVSLGEFDLPAGENLLALRCVGSNPNANPPRRMAGLDYILLEPVQ